MLQVPIDVAFWGKARLGAWFAGLNLAADLLLMADVALHFFRAYVSHNSVVVTSLAQIRRHYLGASSDALHAHTQGIRHSHTCGPVYLALQQVHTRLQT